MGRRWGTLGAARTGGDHARHIHTYYSIDTKNCGTRGPSTWRHPAETLASAYWCSAPELRPRCSSQGHCLQPGGGNGAADAAVGAVLIVIHKEHGQRVESLAVGVIWPLVGPLGLEDLDERLRLAAGQGPEGPRALQSQAPVRRGACQDAAHVAGAVVGQDALGGDAVALEAGVGPLEEASGSRAALVGQGLDVGGAGVDRPRPRGGSRSRAGCDCRRPGGMRPSFLMSRWTRAPGRACS